MRIPRPKDLTPTQRRWAVGGGVAAVGLGVVAWRYLGLSTGAKPLPFGMKAPLGVRGGQLEQAPDRVEFRTRSAARQLAQFNDYELVWAPQVTQRQVTAQLIELTPQPKENGGAAKWIAQAAAAGWDIGIAANGRILVQRHNDDRAPSLRLGGQLDAEGNPLDVLFVRAAPLAPLDKPGRHGDMPLPPLPSGVQPEFPRTLPGVPLPPKVTMLDRHEELRSGYGINWDLLRSLPPKVSFPGLTPDVLERWQSVPGWWTRAGWTPALFNDEKFFDSAYRNPSYQRDEFLYAQDGSPSDRGYLINTPRDGMSRYLAMKKRVNALAPMMGDRTWAIVQSLSAIGQKVNADTAALMDERLGEMRKFFADLVRQAGKAAGGAWAIAAEVVAWLWQNFLKGAGDDKARLNTESFVNDAARVFELTIELGLPPNIHLFTYDFFGGLSGNPWQYTSTLNEITSRAETMSRLAKSSLKAMMSLPKSARDVISAWWMVAVSQLGRDAHARSAFAALMAGKPGAYNLACDEQVYLVGYTIARHYKLDPDVFVPALWDIANGWSAWPGLGTVGVYAARYIGSADMYFSAPRGADGKTLPGYDFYGFREVSKDGLTWLWANDHPTLGGLSFQDYSDPGPGYEGSAWYKDHWGRQLPTAVTVSGDDDERPPVRASTMIPRGFDNNVAVNWFDLALAAFMLADKRKLDWRVGGLR